MLNVERLLNFPARFIGVEIQSKADAVASKEPLVAHNRRIFIVVDGIEKKTRSAFFDAEKLQFIIVQDNGVDAHLEKIELYVVMLFNVPVKGQRGEVLLKDALGVLGSDVDRLDDHGNFVNVADSFKIADRVVFFNV